MTTVLDARWLGKGGVGACTRSLVAAWESYGRPGGGSCGFGQRSAFRVPRGDLAVHLHQTRPLHRGRTAVCVPDLIQMQEPSPAPRLAKTVRLRISVRTSDAVLTVSPSVPASTGRRSPWCTSPPMPPWRRGSQPAGSSWPCSVSA